MMSVKRAIARKGGILAAALLALSGCASGPAPIDHFYRIDVQAPSQSATQPLPGILHVDRFRADALTGERQILYRESSDDLEIHKLSYHRWSDPAPIFLQTELISFLDAAGVAEAVMSANARVESDYHLSGQLHEFERVLGGNSKVVVELQLSLTDSEGNVLIHQRYREEREAANSQVAASADAFSDAVHAVFSRFLADLSSLSSPAPTP